MEGKTQDAKFVVTKEDTALALGSGTLEVLATPRLIAMMENVAMSMVQEELEVGSTTVGTNVNVNHVAATPVGCNVRITATVTKVSGRKIEYSLLAYDDVEKIADGTHARYIVDIARFLSKSQNKI